MEEEELGQLLLDYAATYNNPEYGQDWDLVDSKFPEFAEYDKQVLHDYVATYNNPEYAQDTAVINAKFPELFPVKKKRRRVPAFIIACGWDGTFAGVTIRIGNRQYRIGHTRK